MEERGDGELELAGVRAGGGGVLGVWGRELAREQGDWNVVVSLVLKRAREGEPGLFPELATAAARWRPTGASVVRGRSGGGPARGERAARSPGTTRGRPRRAGGGLRPSLGGGGAALRRRQRKQRGTEEEDTGWTYLQFQKSLGVLL